MCYQLLYGLHFKCQEMISAIGLTVYFVLGEFKTAFLHGFVSKAISTILMLSGYIKWERKCGFNFIAIYMFNTDGLVLWQFT